MKDNFSELAKIYKALSDPNRLKILSEIQKHQACHCQKEDKEFLVYCCIKDIAAQLDVGLSTVSHHIRELVQAGLITVDKKGQTSHCQINEETIPKARNFLKNFQ